MSIAQNPRPGDPSSKLRRERNVRLKDLDRRPVQIRRMGLMNLIDRRGFVQIAAAASMCAALLGLGARPLQVHFGDVNPISKPTEITLSTSAVMPFGSGSITGKVQNMLGSRPMADITVEFQSPTPATGKLPKLKGGTIGGQPLHPVPGSPSGAMNAKFDPPIGNTGSVDVSLETEDPGGSAAFATSFKMLLSPSIQDQAGGHSDFVGGLVFRAGELNQSLDVDGHGNSSITAEFTNVEESGSSKRLVSLRGSYIFDIGDPSSIAGASIANLDGSATPGAVVTIDSPNSFHVSGLSLVAGASKHVVLRFVSIPRGRGTLFIRATLADP